MKRREVTSTADVFINCPFDDKYSKTFEALIFTVYACGFRARSAREVDDCGETRIEKLFRIINECRYGIHDISRTELDAKNKLPRFNMPLELGLFMGARRFGGPAQKQKRLLILDTQKYRYQKFISDIAGSDIHAHGGSPQKAIVEVRNWLADASRRQLLSGTRVVNAYRKFCSEFPVLAREFELDQKKIPYVDFERLVLAWLARKDQPA